MKRRTLLVIGVCSSLSTTPVIAGVSGAGALGSEPGGAPGVAAEKQIGEDSSAAAGGAEGGSSDAAVAAEGKGKTEGVVDTGSARGAASGKPKRTGTGTAARHLNDQVRKGNIKIQGATDADIYQ